MVHYKVPSKILTVEQKKCPWYVHLLQEERLFCSVSLNLKVCGSGLRMCEIFDFTAAAPAADHVGEQA